MKDQTRELLTRLARSNASRPCQTKNYKALAEYIEKIEQRIDIGVQISNVLYNCEQGGLDIVKARDKLFVLRKQWDDVR